ncbi:MAG TPA: 2-oxo-4-hydroxy-4-carboxy-5-ureidoimidazoline decarboxylase [Micromonosporaceae bacterium]|jgi:2-oxo-4-hydroxy-4-carboxy-5-ureidoimidazoline decarboxylase
MDPGLADLNALTDAEARERLRACCAATAWLDAVLAGRPYGDRPALEQASSAALAALDWDGVLRALAAHPRIGERVAARSREAAWSASEQSGVDGATEATRSALADANRAYEDRFGHVLLIFATGRTDEQMLAAARQRLHHDVVVERQTVRSELAKIVALRLTKLLDGS